MDDVQVIDWAAVCQLSSRRLRDLPKWEISRDGQVIGTIRAETIGNARSMFYHAFGRHPGTGAIVNLELSTDFEEVVHVIVRLQDAPAETYGIHWR